MNLLHTLYRRLRISWLRANLTHLQLAMSAIAAVDAPDAPMKLADLMLRAITIQAHIALLEGQQ